MTVKDLVDYCMKQKELGRLFLDWTPEQLALEAANRIDKNELFYSVNAKNEINGAIIIAIDREHKDIFVENIVSSDKHVLFWLMLRITQLHKIPYDGTWRIHGEKAYRKDREFKKDRGFKVTTTYLKRLYIYG